MSLQQENAKKLLPFIQAAAEGKKILREVKYAVFFEERDVCKWEEFDGEEWRADWNFKIEEPPKMVPFGKEDWEKIIRVRRPYEGGPSHVVATVTSTDVQIGDKYFLFADAASRFVQMDGTPCLKPEDSQ